MLALHELTAHELVSAMARASYRRSRWPTSPVSPILPYEGAVQRV